MQCLRNRSFNFGYGEGLARHFVERLGVDQKLIAQSKAHVLLLDTLTLTPVQWAGKPFLPLPVLGIPGWWPANEDLEFYRDKQVFRPAPLKPGHKP